MNESGATLAWKTLFPDEPIPAFLSYIRDRDLWNFELPLSEEIHEAMGFLGRKLHQLDFLATLTADELIYVLTPIGAKLLAPKRKRIKEIAATAYETTIGDLPVMAEIPESDARLVSDTCSKVYKSRPFHAYVLAYCWNSRDEAWDLSFRSDKNSGNFDVSAIAKQYSGGGHRNAAGAKVKDLQKVLEQ